MLMSLFSREDVATKYELIGHEHSFIMIFAVTEAPSCNSSSGYHVRIHNTIYLPFVPMILLPKG
jgi:hypothetical protein